MCNNLTIKAACREMTARAVALESLKAHWARNNAYGVAAIWTTDGPRFFNMAKTSPADALRAIKDDTGADWATVAEWVKSVSIDDLH